MRRQHINCCLWYLTCLGAEYIPPEIPTPPDKLNRSPRPPIKPAGWAGAGPPSSWKTESNKDCITGTRFNHGTCSGCLHYKCINWYNLTLEYSAVGLNRIILNTFGCNKASSVATIENNWDELTHMVIKLDCLFFQLEDQCESWLRLAKENKLPDLPRRTSLRTVANILVS